MCVLSVGYGEVGGVLSQVQTGFFPFWYYPVDDDNYFLGDKDARQQIRHHFEQNTTFRGPLQGAEGETYKQSFRLP